MQPSLGKEIDGRDFKKWLQKNKVVLIHYFSFLYVMFVQKDKEVTSKELGPIDMKPSLISQLLFLPNNLFALTHLYQSMFIGTKFHVLIY